MQITTTFSNAVREALALSLAVAVGLYTFFILFEPAVSLGQSSEQFEIALTITDEITFLTAPSNVTLSPSLSGITGGTANGATQMVVSTNNPTGYNMTLTASSSAGMLGDTNGGTIPAYIPSTTGVPDFTFTTPANKARFGYTVEASTTADLDQSFLDNGSSCNTGSADASDSCWLNASTSAETIINRSSETPGSGATTTLKFRVVIQSNPSPTVPSDTYTATTTVTATVNP